MKKKLLIVDDHPNSRVHLHKMLAETYDLEELDSGEEALELLARGKQPDAILLDLDEGGERDAEFLQRFAQYPSSKQVPVLVSIVWRDEARGVEAVRLGAWDVVTKPYVSEIVRLRIKNAILRSEVGAFRELKYKAEYDVLTNIFNKETFFKKTAQMLWEYPDRHFSMIRFDIDRFHLVNAYFGAAYGDRLLQFVAGTLATRRAPGLEQMTYGRIGSDIFAVCVPTGDRKELEALIERYRGWLGEFDAEFEILFTFGICIIQSNATPVDKIYDHATLAAKTHKGNYLTACAFYEDAMEQRVAWEQELVNEMNTALTQGQFEVWYQPKYDIVTEQPAGAEALVRWNHPRKGMIPPGDFVPVLEKNGLINRLDHYVWERVCRDLNRWKGEDGPQLPISVNVSRIDLSEQQLVEHLLELTRRWGIPKSMLQLELTESAYTDNPARMVQLIKQFRQAGFTILMDDFGSGYSSLSVLKDMDVDVLKIDMLFFSRTAEERRRKQIVASIIRMAKLLGIPVVAEGVERREEVEFLRGEGCEFVQGYYYAKPMPVEEFCRHVQQRLSQPPSRMGEPMKNKYMEAQVENMQATTRAFVQGCEMAALQNDGRTDREEERALKKLRAISDRFIRELEELK